MSIRNVTDIGKAQGKASTGYCLGGTMRTVFAALHPERVQNLTLLAVPVDFATRDGLLNVWTQPEYFNVDKFVDALGNCPPQLLQSILCLMRFLDPAGQWLHLPPRRKIGIFAPVPASKAAPQTGLVLYVFGGWRESVFKPSTLMKKLENTV